MSNQDNHSAPHSAPSTLQPLIVILGLLLAVGFLIALFTGKPVTEEVPAAVAKVTEAVAPVAAVAVAEPVTAHVARTGDEVVKGVCAMCHAAGLMNAPTIGNAEQWAPRIAQGYDTIVKNAINGVRSMPARGGNPDLTDAEVAEAVIVMANASGANFELPKAEAK